MKSKRNHLHNGERGSNDVMSMCTDIYVSSLVKRLLLSFAGAATVL